ncbi:MAG TPA: GNAT family N-acetyltransferase [Dehalococcoidia bacterium]|nr:GNAT family N-acetyltransferase [Dehalococcoidia bacterium]
MIREERARLVERYRRGHRDIMSLLALPGTLPLDFAPEGEWSARQVVHHLADTEVFRCTRLRRLLSEDQPLVQAFDELRLAERAYYSRPIEASLALFDAGVRSSLEFIDSMTEQDWSKEGTHSELGRFSMEDWLVRAADHLAQHAEQLRRTLEAGGGPLAVTVEPLVAERLKPWLTDLLARNHSARVVSRGRMYFPAELPGFVARIGGRPIALATYLVEGAECQLVTLHSEVENVGAGSALIAAVRAEAANAGCRRLWLITTNDNTHAIRFYQRRGFRLAHAHVGAIDAVSRPLKPEIPFAGNDGIPIRDEIEMDLLLP